MKPEKDTTNIFAYSNTDEVYFKITNRDSSEINIASLEKDSQAFLLIRKFHTGDFHHTNWNKHAINEYELICPKTLKKTEIIESGFKVIGFKDSKYKNAISNSCQEYTIINPFGQKDTITTGEMNRFLNGYIRNQQLHSYYNCVAYYGQNSFLNVLNFIKFISSHNFSTIKEVKLQTQILELSKMIK